MTQLLILASLGGPNMGIITALLIFMAARFHMEMEW